MKDIMPITNDMYERVGGNDVGPDELLSMVVCGWW